MTISSSAAVEIVRVANATLTGDGTTYALASAKITPALIALLALGGTKDEIAAGFGVSARNVSLTNDLVSLLCAGMYLGGNNTDHVVKAPQG